MTCCNVTILKAKLRLNWESMASLPPIYARAVDATADQGSPSGMGQSSDEGRATKERPQSGLREHWAHVLETRGHGQESESF